MGATGNGLAVGDGVDPLDHVAGYAVMRPKAGASCPGGKSQLVVRNVLGRGTITGMMALHAQGAEARVSDRGAFREGVNVGGA